MAIPPGRNTLTTRSGVARRGRDAGHPAAGSGSPGLTGTVSSASPPPLSTHRVATATANHKRAARGGSLRRVRCHGHPPRFGSLKPGSIPARSPSHHASPALGARSVKNHQGSA
jgi:hypothetical protein